MVINTINVDGLVIQTKWDPRFAGPVELLITIDHATRPTGKGITNKNIQQLSLQAMAPETMKTLGSLRTIGDWLLNNKPALRKRPVDPDLFYGHVSLFVVLAVQEGCKGVTKVLANYAGVRPARAREWVETARRLGLLTNTGSGQWRGRAHGMLTDKARAVLSSQLVTVEGEAA